MRILAKSSASDLLDPADTRRARQVGPAVGEPAHAGAPAGCCTRHAHT
jgi:hypothetical protein